MRDFKIFWCMLVLTMVVWWMPAVQVQAAEGKVFLAKDAEWKYLDSGQDLGTAWRQPDYQDDFWKSGKAPLGYGDDYSETEPDLPLATAVDFGDEDDKHMTTYFRTTVNGDALVDYAALECYIHVDDGAVVYINGQEAFRRGIPENVTVSYATGAKFKQKEDTFTLPVSLLQPGRNVIAVEVHQDDGSSSDLWFEMSMKGIAK